MAGYPPLVPEIDDETTRTLMNLPMVSFFFRLSPGFLLGVQLNRSVKTFFLSFLSKFRLAGANT